MCVLELLSERYPIDLVPIPLHERKVIVEMDCLNPNWAMVDYGYQLVQVRTPIRGELLIHSEGA